MNYRRLEVLEDAAAAVLSVADFKTSARTFTGTVEDTFISGVIKAAQVMVENHTGLSLTVKKLRMKLSGWPCGRSSPALLYPPVVSVESIKYLDDANVEQTLDPVVYDLDVIGTMRPVFWRAYSQVWPVLRHHPTPVAIEYTAGYPDEECPRPLVEAVRMIAQDLYENREAQIVSQYFGERSAIPNPMMSRMLFPYTLVEF